MIIKKERLFTELIIEVFFMGIFLSMITYDYFGIKITMLVAGASAWIKIIFSSGINKKYLLYCLFVLLSGLINHILVGNCELITPVYSVLMAGGIAYVMNIHKCNFFMSIVNYSIVSLYHLYYFVTNEFSLNGIYSNRSINYVSVVFLLMLLYYHIASIGNEKKVSVIPGIIATFFSYVAQGRGGIIAISLYLVLYYCVYYLKGKQIKVIIRNMIIIGISIIYIMYLYNHGYFETVFIRFSNISKTSNSIRAIIINEYLSNSTNSFKNLVFGVPYKTVSYLEMYDRNTHNSYINGHELFGLPYLLVNFYIIANLLYSSLKNKKWDIFIIFIVIFVRAMTDLVFSYFYGDIILYLCIAMITTKSSMLFGNKDFEYKNQ